MSPRLVLPPLSSVVPYFPYAEVGKLVRSRGSYPTLVAPGSVPHLMKVERGGGETASFSSSKSSFGRWGGRISSPALMPPNQFPWIPNNRVISVVLPRWGIVPALPSVVAGWGQYQFSHSHELIASFPAHYRHQVAGEGRQSLSLTYSIIWQGVDRSPMQICCTGLPVPLKLGSVLLHFPRIGAGPTLLSATAGE